MQRVDVCMCGLVLDSSSVCLVAVLRGQGIDVDHLVTIGTRSVLSTYVRAIWK